MKLARLICWSCALIAAGLTCPDFAKGELAYPTAWSRQTGTSNYEDGRSVAVDALGNVYLSGDTEGSLAGSNVGESDIFLTKFDSTGMPVWSRQLGTTVDDNCKSVAIDALGNAYISGSSNGNLGGNNSGAVLIKYDASGSHLWSRQLFASFGESVATDAVGNVFTSGTTSTNLARPLEGINDVFLAKYDSSGNLLWTRQFGGTTNDLGRSVAVDVLGNAYVSGYTFASVGGPNAGSADAFLVKYDSSGDLLWSRQFGTSAADFGLSVAADAVGNAYVTGATDGNLGGNQFGSRDIFLTKYDATGNPLWSRQLGTSTTEESHSVTVDAFGNVYISGYTGDSLGGPLAGVVDAFLCKFSAEGDLLWTHQIGTAAYDASRSVAIDVVGNVYMAGITSGSLPGPNAGSFDAYVMKFSPVPEPGSYTLLPAGIAGMFVICRRVRRRRR